jgi:serine phosphatase RsbU (regulator of sigma subunit)
MVYLSTNVSTHLLLKTQAKIAATEADLRFASSIQTDALPPVAPEFSSHPNLLLRASMNTAREVGGDFYDYFDIDDHRMCFVIADVSGKGTPAALFMMKTKTVIKDYALTSESTARILTAVNGRLIENNREGMFATAWIGILDTHTLLLQYTNSGHNYPLLKHDGEPAAPIKKNHGMVLAGLENMVYKQSIIQLQEGDRLFLYTDGVTEAHNPAQELYGPERLCALIDDAAGDSPEELLSRVLDDVNRFAASEPQYDDITMMVLTIKKNSETAE